MSLLNKNKAFSTGDFLFVAVGVLLLGWFFYGYSSQEPRSIINTKLNKSAARSLASEAYAGLGYNRGSDRAAVTFKSNSKLLDSLQHSLGRPQMIATLSDTVHPGIHPYYWDIEFSNAHSNDQVNARSARDNIEIRLDEQGNLIGLENDDYKLPAHTVNKEAILAAFDLGKDTSFVRSVTDSTLHRILEFDLKAQVTPSGLNDSLNQKKSPHTFKKSNIKKLAAYHLQKSGWDADNLEVDEIEIKTLRSRAAAKVSLRNKTDNFGQELKVSMTLLPTGSLIALGAKYNEDKSRNRPNPFEIMRVIIVLIFAIMVVVLLYFRIRSRAVDTNPALVIGVLSGLGVSLIILLLDLSVGSLFGDGAHSLSLLQLGLKMGVSSAFISVAVFAIVAVGDSLMREHWPEKLSSYDYIRQGMLFNKPIGEMLVRSVVLAAGVCGLWSIALSIMPSLYFEISRSFIFYQAAWSPIYAFLDAGWYSFIFILCIYSIFAIKVQGWFNSKVITAILVILSFSLLTPVLSAGPQLWASLLYGFVGLVFTLIFLKWDLMTTLLTHFLFLLLLQTATGWMVEGSPDLYTFIIAGIFLLLLTVIGIVFMAKGTTSQSLPGFVPDYVEELAQEERIKQELQIARDVQQSFLPVETPQISGLDIAAICKPAYETGGDYYDIIQIDDHRLAVTIGDVSGKSIQAAFYMTFIKGILHSLCRETDSPAEILKKTNRLFYDNAPRGTFISLVYGIVDLNDNTFHFARAGHNPILKIDAGDENAHELRPEGIGVGLTQGDHFDDNMEELKVEMDKDGTLVLYTDGIVEALNKNHTFYGTGRLHNFLQRNRTLSAEALLHKLSDDLYSFMGDTKQHDDMTVVVIKFGEH